MAWIYLADMAGSPSHCQSGLTQSYTVKSTNTLKEFYSQGCQKIGYLSPLYGTMFQHSMESPSEDTPTLSVGVSPARTSALREMVKAWQESEADFSSKCVVWSKKSSPVSSSWKTSRPLELGVFEKSLEPLQIWGMTVGGLVYLPQKLEPLTLEKGGSYWRTPKAMEPEEDYQTYITRMKKSLDPKTNTKRRPNNLAMQVNLPQYCPTPTASSYGSNQGGGAGRSGEVRHSLESLARKEGGKLNPTWVEWLMGVPTGWTELKPWVTEWFRNRQEQHLKGSRMLKRWEGE